MGLQCCGETVGNNSVFEQATITAKCLRGYFCSMGKGGEGNRCYSGSEFNSPPPQPPSYSVQVNLLPSFWSHE